MTPLATSSNEHRRSLSRILRELCETPDEEAITISEIADRMGRRAFGALLFVFSVPNLLPLPPGGTTITGVPLILIAPQVALGVRTPWLPRKVREHRLKGTDLDRMFGRILPRLEAVERLSRARLTFFFGPVGDRIIGVICTLLAVVVILPIPLGNLVPAIAIAFLSLALFQRDGVLALIGYLVAVISAGLLVIGAGAVVLAVRELMGFFGS